MVSDNCLDKTGATSAGLSGLTIGGMWKSIAERENHLDKYPRVKEKTTINEI